MFPEVLTQFLAQHGALTINMTRMYPYTYTLHNNSIPLALRLMKTLHLWVLRLFGAP